MFTCGVVAQLMGLRAMFVMDGVIPLVGLFAFAVTRRRPVKAQIGG
ncbi:MAG: hypothetical protein QXT45_06670 [Candidatus Bilamarchaeaceae archaeon]